MGLVALNQHTFFGKPTGRRSERTTMAVVAQVNDGAGRWLRSVVSGRPLRRHHAARRQHGSVKAKVQLLPFDGDEYGVFAFVDSILLLNESQSSERLSLTQRLMTSPMVRSAATELVAVQDEAIARYEAESTSGMLGPEQRSAASQKAVHQRNLRDAFNRASEAPEQHILLVASQPLQSFPCLGALDATAQLIPRDESNSDASRRRSSLGWAFARESPIATAIVRKTCQISVGRAAMLVAQRLLRMPTPAAASVLRPTGSVPDVTLVKPRKWLRVASDLPI